ncbi:MAG: hypothetical protein HUU15_13555 [Candidatus Brocadiae bacterium]|nr:hypothetical protein [Candidatus Brocadiia bacterium]
MDCTSCTTGGSCEGGLKSPLVTEDLPVAMPPVAPNGLRVAEQLGLGSGSRTASNTDPQAEFQETTMSGGGCACKDGRPGEGVPIAPDSSPRTPCGTGPERSVLVWDPLALAPSALEFAARLSCA